MKKVNVFVFPCGGEIGLEIYRSLIQAKHFNVIGGSSVKDHGAFVYENCIMDIPFIHSDEFIPKLNKLVEDHNIDFIFPAHDAVVLKLAEAHQDGKLKCKVVASPYETCSLLRSKETTYEHFKNILPIPKSFNSSSEVQDKDFPVFLKPAIAEGSNGIKKVNNRKELDFELLQDPDLMVLEYLPGDEYTIDCFTDRHGKLLFSEGRGRARIRKEGICGNSFKVHNPKFKELALKINETLKFRGTWLYQVKERANGELALLEIFPKIGGTMQYHRAKGVNFAILSLFDAMDKDVSVFENKFELELDRSLKTRYKHNVEYNHVYIDFDDTVILNDKVQTSVIAFLFQCINDGKKIHLITKHATDIHKTLEKYRLTDIFDEIIHLQNSDEKYKFIKHSDAIFVDEAHNERKPVFEKLGLPVFNTDMIEVLLKS